MSLAPGTRLGPYEIREPLGAGGMGEVYKARDTRLDRTVAIKVAKENFSERFEREARAIAALNHPHICQLYDVGPNYLVMEYVDGVPLKGPLPLEEALRLATQICDALDAAHRKGVVHRDLKPANILVTKGGVKLLDFGLARMSASADDPTITGVGDVMGTPAYMAPERWEGKAADARSDIYAFGCVLYEMMTGKRATQEHVRVEPDSVERVLAGCLATDPEDRWQSTRDVRRALAFAPSPAVSVRRPWRERVAWAILATALLGSSLYLGFARERAPEANEVTRFSVYPPNDSTFNGPVYVTVPRPQFALSPDGRYLAFVASAPGARAALWLRAFDTTEPRAIPGTDYAEFPFWSPDSTSVAFFAEGQVKRVRIADGVVQSIVDVKELDPRGGSWGPDGTILIGTGNGPVYRAAAGGGTAAQPVTALDRDAKEASHRWPSLLPDGRHFIITIRGETPERRGIYVASADSTVKKFLVQSDSNGLYVAPGLLVFSDGGTLLGQAFDTGRQELTGQSFVIAERVAVDSRGAVSFSASLGGALAYAVPNLDQIGRLTWFDRRGNAMGAVGAEGDYVDLRLSPDGQHLLYSASSSTASELWLLPLKDRKPQRLLRWPSLGSQATFSPDGRLIAYGSDESGRFEVYAQTFPLSDWKRPISVGGGSEPRWKADGSEIYYLSDDRKLMAVTVGPGPTFGVPRSLFQTGIATGFAPFRIRYAPSPDGQRFLINTQVGDARQSPIIVVLNWQAALAR